jgi:hypothetical protein
MRAAAESALLLWPNALPHAAPATMLSAATATIPPVRLLAHSKFMMFLLSWIRWPRATSPNRAHNIPETCSCKWILARIPEPGLAAINRCFQIPVWKSNPCSAGKLLYC